MFKKYKKNKRKERTKRYVYILPLDDITLTHQTEEDMQQVTPFQMFMLRRLLPQETPMPNVEGKTDIP